MEIITKNQFLKNKEFYFQEIQKGKIFVYPTDTIYGVGCNAFNKKSILKIREIKKREKKPFSIIVPSIGWIKKNCSFNYENELKKLPGQYTFIVNLENVILPFNELVGNIKTIGVRIPDNWFTKELSKKEIVFVTTSVNISGEPYLTEPNNLKKEIFKEIDYIIDDGILNGKPSTIIDLTKDKKILRK